MKSPTLEQRRRLAEFDDTERILQKHLKELHERRGAYISTNQLNENAGREMITDLSEKHGKTQITVREFLFRGIDGCMDGNCVITGERGGMHTNGGCHCIQNLSRGHMSILASRLRVIADKKVILDSV